MKVLLCIAVLFLNCPLAFAHSCATFKNLPDKEYNEKLSEVDRIFEGETVSVTDLGYQSYLIKLKVLTVWKGDKAKEITIKYGNPCSPQAPSVGAKWILYGYKQENEKYLSVNCCCPFDDTRMKLVYGAGEAVKHPEDISELSKKGASAKGCWSWLLNKISFFSSS